MAWRTRAGEAIRQSNPPPVFLRLSTPHLHTFSVGSHSRSGWPAFSSADKIVSSPRSLTSIATLHTALVWPMSVRRHTPSRKSHTCNAVCVCESV
eukprot:34341-Chlamydomonas_euryale.AAC.1